MFADKYYCDGDVSVNVNTEHLTFFTNFRNKLYVSEQCTRACVEENYANSITNISTLGMLLIQLD